MLRVSKCTLLIDRATEQCLTECVFCDSNIDKLKADEERGGTRRKDQAGGSS